MVDVLPSACTAPIPWGQACPQGCAICGTLRALIACSILTPPGLEVACYFKDRI